MARLPKPWWRESKKCWYVKLKGVQTRLDPDEKKATKKFYELLGKQPAAASSTMLTVRLLDRYLVWSKANHAPRTHKGIKANVESFAAFIGAVRVHKLLPSHLTEWIDKRCPRHPADDSKAVSDNTRRNYLADVIGAFNWAASAEQRIIPYSPFGGYRKPKKTPRALCLTADQWSKVFAEIDSGDPFWDYLMILRNTGCRPQEARIMEARHVDLKARLICFKDGEIPGGKRGHSIPISDDATLGIVKRRVLKYPEGPILRNRRGRPWNKNSLNCRFQRLSEKLKFRVHAYVARHSMATELLEAGASAGAVAAILGHSSPMMVLNVYGKHIEEREAHLRDCMAKALQRRA